MHEGHKVWHLLPLALFYHKWHHGLKLHRLGKLDFVVLLQPIKVIGNFNTDECMVLMLKKVLQVIRDAISVARKEGIGH
jgi:hypothetical protein